MTSSTTLLEKAAAGALPKFENIPIQSIFPFDKIVILDVISDPTDCLNENFKTRWHEMGVSNMQYADVLPRNTIIGKKIESDTNPSFYFPFFPSHLALPCKPGEMVWAINDGNSYYWFCKITLPHTVDDVNHTHPGRIYEPTLRNSTKDLAEREENGLDDQDVWYELRNSRPVMAGNSRISSTTQILKGEDELIFEALLQESKASDYCVYEAVPRYKKRPADVALEGSNNSLLVLGIDRIDGLQVEFDQKSGMIDIVAGRGCTPETMGQIANTTSIDTASENLKGLVLKEEIDKSPERMSNQEGDVDLKNDRARLRVSQRNQVDKNFNLRDYNSQFGISDSELGDASVVGKADKIRLIARSDIQFIVKNYNLADDKDQKNEDDNPDNWVSITLSTTGDVIIKPSKLGFIKLGGSEADKAILCTDFPAITGDGKISKNTGALSNTMGGKFGGTNIPGQGTWASKILVTGLKYARNNA